MAVIETCDRCLVAISEDSRGLDDIHCQSCWEDICSRSWWEMLRSLPVVNTSEELDGELEQ